MNIQPLLSFRPPCSLLDRQCHWNDKRREKSTLKAYSVISRSGSYSCLNLSFIQTACFLHLDEPRHWVPVQNSVDHMVSADGYNVHSFTGCSTALSTIAWGNFSMRERALRALQMISDLWERLFMSLWNLMKLRAVFLSYICDFLKKKWYMLWLTGISFFFLRVWRVFFNLKLSLIDPKGSKH